MTENPLTLTQRIVCVIPALNEAANIETCIRSLYANDSSLSEVEIIVADGGSIDGTPEIVGRLQSEYPNLKLIHNTKKTQAAGVNLGAVEGEAERDILIRCDGHAEYPENYLISLTQSMLQRDCESLVVPMDAVGTGCFQKANAWVVDTPLGSGGSAHRGGIKSGYVDHGHHAAFQRYKFLELGGYDETFTHNEDAEYDARLAKHGGRVYLDADIRIGYFPRRNPLALWRQYFGYGRGRARNLMKNRSVPRLRQMAPVINLLALVGACVAAAFNQVWLFYPYFYLVTLVLVSMWFVVAKKSICGLFAGLALGVMHIAWPFGFLSAGFGNKKPS